MNPFIWLEDNYYWNDETHKVVDENGNVFEYKDIPQKIRERLKLLGLIMPNGLDKVLYQNFEIDLRIKEIAEKINEDYKDIKDPLILVGVLKGCFIFMADLSRYLRIPHVIDFMSVSSYGDKIENDGNVRIIMDCRVNQKGRDVLIVEDIVDSGYTLNYLVNNFKSRGTNSVKSATLLDKPKGRKVDFEADYVGFELTDNSWVVGYGLDAFEKWRTLPYIATIKRN